MLEYLVGRRQNGRTLRVVLDRNARNLPDRLIWVTCCLAETQNINLQWCCGQDSQPEHDCRSDADGGEEKFAASVVTCRDPAPVLEAGEKVLDPVSLLVERPIVPGGVLRPRRAGMQDVMPLSSNASLNQSAS